jgi:hypothetical protein
MAVSIATECLGLTKDRPTNYSGKCTSGVSMVTSIRHHHGEKSPVQTIMLDARRCFGAPLEVPIRARQEIR